MTTNQMATVTIRDVAWKLARGGQIACVDPVDDPDGTVIRRRSNAANRALAGLGLELCRSVSGEDVVWTVRRIATNQGTCDLEA